MSAAVIRVKMVPHVMMVLRAIHATVQMVTLEHFVKMVSY